MAIRNNFFITAVRYNTEDCVSIKELEVINLVNNKVEIFTKEQVFDLISQGFTFCTVYLNDEGVYEIGSDLGAFRSRLSNGIRTIYLRIDVSVEVVRYRDYLGIPTTSLRIVGNKEKADNLGELPTF